MLLFKTVNDHILELSATQCVDSTGDLYWKGAHSGLRLDTEYPHWRLRGFSHFLIDNSGVSQFKPQALSLTTVPIHKLIRMLLFDAPYSRVITANLNTAYIKLINKLYFIKTDQCTNILFILLYEHRVTPTCFSPQRAILRKYDWYIFTARSTKCVADVQFSLLSSVCYITRQILVVVA
jgi:hypothetical protein